jgi:hypothetical protein
MSSTLTQVQTLTRALLGDEDIDLTTTANLAVVNSVYRQLVRLHQWPEWYREYTTLSTTAGTEAYTWPTDPVFFDTLSIEVQDWTDDMEYKTIPAAKSTTEWNRARRWENGFPYLYRRIYTTSEQLQFAPTPLEGSSTIRITGISEPNAANTTGKALTAGADTTLFNTDGADEILAVMIAALYADKREFPSRAQRLLSSAALSLSAITGREITPEEIAPVGVGR